MQPLTPETAVRFYINLYSCFLTLRGALTHDSSHNYGSSFCTMTGLDLGSVFPEYKLIKKKKKKVSDYLILLFRTQHFIQYFGIIYHRGAWYIMHNSNLVQGASPGVPYQPVPLLDYSMNATIGTVVPQRRRTSADEVDIRRHVESAVLQLPIFFVNHNGSLGFRLPDILRGCNPELHNANSFAPLGGKTTTSVRIHVSLSLGYMVTRVL